AVCSSVMVVYWMGMSQPPKSTMRAPCATCQSYKGVRIDHLAPGKVHPSGGQFRETGQSLQGRLPAPENMVRGKLGGGESRHSVLPGTTPPTIERVLQEAARRTNLMSRGLCPALAALLLLALATPLFAQDGPPPPPRPSNPPGEPLALWPPPPP